eukprot:Rmarinus@m.5766
MSIEETPPIVVPDSIISLSLGKQFETLLARHTPKVKTLQKKTYKQMFNLLDSRAKRKEKLETLESHISENTFPKALSKAITIPNTVVFAKEDDSDLAKQIREADLQLRSSLLHGMVVQA